jgi:hypothetical protein
MKIIKINNRYTMAKFGFTLAMVWDRWDNPLVNPYEMAFLQAFGYHSFRLNANWYTRFGSRKNGRRPYSIYVKNLDMITTVLLMVDSK